MLLIESEKSKTKDGKGYVHVVYVHGRMYIFAVRAVDWADADDLARVFFSSAKIKS